MLAWKSLDREYWNGPLILATLDTLGAKKQRHFHDLHRFGAKIHFVQENGAAPIFIFQCKKGKELYRFEVIFFNSNYVDQGYTTSVPRDDEICNFSGPKRTVYGDAGLKARPPILGRA